MDLVRVTVVTLMIIPRMKRVMNVTIHVMNVLELQALIVQHVILLKTEP